MSKQPIKALFLAALIAATEANATNNPFTVTQRVETTLGYQVTLANSTDEATLNVVYHDGDNFIVSTEEIEHPDACDITASDSDDACAIIATDTFDLYAESWESEDIRYMIIRREGAMLAYLQVEGGEIQWNSQNAELLDGVEMLVASASIELNYAVDDSTSQEIMQAILDWIKEQ